MPLGSQVYAIVRLSESKLCIDKMGIIGSEQFWEKYKSGCGTLINNEKDGGMGRLHFKKTWSSVGNIVHKRGLDGGCKLTWNKVLELKETGKRAKRKIN